MEPIIKVVIPAYKVKGQILTLLEQIGSMVNEIIVVDDCCPEESGKWVKQNVKDPRVKVIFNQENKGVGGAVIAGYMEFLKSTDKEDFIVFKIDGDGQMNPNLLPLFIEKIENSNADFVKGNRFYNIRKLNSMPAIRLFGNSMLSLINKLVNGYWHVMDPTNGYIGIRKSTLEQIELDKVDNRYFFESDMLFRLSLIKGKVVDCPMEAKYEEEQSSLNVWRILFEFPPKYLNRFLKRLFYNYFLRDFNAGTLQLSFGLLFFAFGISFGLYHWVSSIYSGVPALTGTIMLAALPTIFGFQLLLGFLNYDIQSKN